MDEAVIAYINAGWESSEARINGDKVLIRVTRNTEERAEKLLLGLVQVSIGFDALNAKLVWTEKG